jgi:ubiquinone/menaquinone biosynthesis C-methylase UbiE
MRDNRSYYDSFSETYEIGRERPYHRFLDDSELALVRPHIEDRDVLEVGCGTGLILEQLQLVARRAVGVDLSPGMLAHAQQRGLEAVEGNATDLPFLDASFDVTCSFKVLAHVESICEALSEMSRVTRPGGRIIAEFYNAKSLRSLVKRFGPAGAIGRDEQATEREVYTRFDTLGEIENYLPAELTLERVDGIRILAPSAHFFNLPVIGTFWPYLERLAMKTSLRHLGGFLVVTLVRQSQIDSPSPN